MNFEVNGVSYFLTFDTDKAQWFLFTPSSNGIESMKIHNDDMTAPVPLAA